MPEKKTSAIGKLFLDTIFPIKCLSCGKEGCWICDSCLEKIPLRSEHVCGICEKNITPHGFTCHSCLRKNKLDGLFPVTYYSHALIAKAIHTYKYCFVSDLHVPLGRLMTNALRKSEIPLPDLIVPVPIHPRRLRWRGFNQASLLAKYISSNLLPDLELEVSYDTLKRTKYTQPQMEIKDFSKRKENISRAFAMTKEEIVKEKIILLIDDVATTGSTILECARILKAAKAKGVYAAVIARQEMKKI